MKTKPDISKDFTIDDIERRGERFFAPTTIRFALTVNHYIHLLIASLRKAKHYLFH